MTHCDPPPSCALPLTGWRIGRHARLGAAARNLRVVEDTPFYARSMTLPVVPGATQVVHESLSLERFAQPWVQTLLPFRMGRRRSPRRA